MTVAAERKWHSVAECCDMLGISEDTLRRRIKEGALESNKVGGRVLIAADELERFVESNTTLRPKADEHAELFADPLRYMAAKIGVSPRVAAMRPELADEFDLVTPGEHFANFSKVFCRHTRLVEGGPKLGSPVVMQDYQRELFDEALECDDDGRRVYSTVGGVWPRKTAKTTTISIACLYGGSPADGEHRPEVVMAASVKHQAGKLYGNATAFVNDPLYGSPELRRIFTAQASAILCPSIGGIIQRVAGDGDSNHSLDPHLVALDELWTWKTPKQLENFNALTTAQGARIDPLTFFISTEGDDDENALATLLGRIEDSDQVETEHRRPGLTIYRSREAGLLVFKYQIAADATIDDIDAFVLANPAPWRTPKRLAKDLADPRHPPETKLRLYGNRRGTGAGRWIGDDKIAQMIQPKRVIPKGAEVVAAVDAAKTRDCTACTWSWVDSDGVIVQRSRVWACRQDRPHDVFVPGGRLDNDLIRDFILDELAAEFALKLLFYDERYFGDQAVEIAATGVTAVEMHQGKTEMRAAWDEYYHAIYEGAKPSIALGGDEGPLQTLIRHIKNAVGTQTDRGWYVTKKGGKGSILVIDALASSVMGRYGAAHFLEFVPKRRAVLRSF